MNHGVKYRRTASFWFLLLTLLPACASSSRPVPPAPPAVPAPLSAAVPVVVPFTFTGDAALVAADTELRPDPKTAAPAVVALKRGERLYIRGREPAPVAGADGDFQFYRYSVATLDGRSGSVSGEFLILPEPMPAALGDIARVSDLDGDGRPESIAFGRRDLLEACLGEPRPVADGYLVVSNADFSRVDFQLISQSGQCREMFSPYKIALKDATGDGRPEILLSLSHDLTEVGYTHQQLRILRWTGTGLAALLDVDIPRINSSCVNRFAVSRAVIGKGEVTISEILYTPCGAMVKGRPAAGDEECPAVFSLTYRPDAAGLQFVKSRPGPLLPVFAQIAAASAEPHEKPGESGKSVCVVPAGTRVRVLGFDNACGHEARVAAPSGRTCTVEARRLVFDDDFLNDALRDEESGRERGAVEW